VPARHEGVPARRGVDTWQESTRRECQKKHDVKKKHAAMSKKSMIMALWQQPSFIAMVATTLFIHSFIAYNTATLD
jgi:hypothetical protein